MTDSSDTRVAVYIDFDNIVISRYDRVHGRGHFQRDRLFEAGRPDAAAVEKLQQARVDVGAIIDYASSFGTLVLTRAYADWSAPVNADYRGQLVGRAVDLVQLFPAAAYAKNGADIRLAVDAVEDMFRLPDLTHVVIVAGDSDYIPLAQRCKRLGRYVVGVGVAGSTSKSLGAACDELVTYDALPGITTPPPVAKAGPAATTGKGARKGQPARDKSAMGEPTKDESTKDESTKEEAAGEPAEESAAQEPAKGRSGTGKSGGRRVARRRQGEPDSVEPEDGDRPAEGHVTEADAEDPQEVATRLLERALRLGHEKDDADWLHSSAVKTQMRRMDPSFSDRALGYRSFSDFVKSRGEIAELDESGDARMVRLVTAGGR